MSVALPMSALGVKRKYRSPRAAPVHRDIPSRLPHVGSQNVAGESGVCCAPHRCGMAKRYRESATDTAGLIILIQDGDDL
jgi:hypothetical protein